MTGLRLLLVTLASLALAGPALAGTTPAPTTAEGVIVGLTSSSISFRPDGSNALTCAVAPAQGAALGPLHLVPGLRVKLACRLDGTRFVLVSIKRLDGTGKSQAPTGTTTTTPGAATTTPAPTAAPKPPPAPVRNTYGVGAITAFTSTLITVGTDGGPVTCFLSPVQAASLTAVARLGQRVKIACRQEGGRLLFLGIARADAASAPAAPAKPTTTPAPATGAGTVRELSGSLSALRTDALVVAGEGGVSLTCLFGPELGAKVSALGLAVGARVRVACRVYGDRAYLSAISKP
jgi:hypothetical protein